MPRWFRAETKESIRYNAPLQYTSQDRQSQQQIMNQLLRLYILMHYQLVLRVEKMTKQPVYGVVKISIKAASVQH
ncbi:MAG: hypothetical protein CM15mV25_0110 [uncultured marine virus]|nr:MAG: hypothetical protein CM15mV25_0110 [uncultured marine virus]